MAGVSPAGRSAPQQRVRRDGERLPPVPDRAVARQLFVKIAEHHLALEIGPQRQAEQPLGSDRWPGRRSSRSSQASEGGSQERLQSVPQPHQGQPRRLERANGGGRDGEDSAARVRRARAADRRRATAGSLSFPADPAPYRAPRARPSARSGPRSARGWARRRPRHRAGGQPAARSVRARPGRSQAYDCIVGYIRGTRSRVPREVAGSEVEDR